MHTDTDLMKALLAERVEIVGWIFDYAIKVERETGIYGVGLATVIRDVAGKLNTYTDKADKADKTVS